MSFRWITLFIFHLITLTFFSGCGDLFNKKVKDTPISSSRYSANCELEVENFSKILEKQIPDTIKCLGANLFLFIDIVDSKKPGYLSRTELENFIKRTRTDIKPEVLKAMKAVFDLNHLVFGDEIDYISRENIKKLIDFTLLFNQQASEIYEPIFLYPGETTYELHRVWRDKQVATAARLVMSGLKKIFVQNQKARARSINIVSVLDAFLSEDTSFGVTKLKKFLFIKEVLLGGEREILTYPEFKHLLDHLDSLVLISLDAVRFNKIQMGQDSNKRDMAHFLKQDVELLSNIVFPYGVNRSGKTLFSLREAVNGAKLILKETGSDLDLDKYYDLISEAKTILMGGIGATVKSEDLKQLFDHLLNVLDTGVYFYQFWDSKRSVLERYLPVISDFEDLKVQFSTQANRVDEFARIVKNYRFMKGEYVSPFYSYDYRRNANAVYEIALIEYGLKLVFKKYGCPNMEINGVACRQDTGSLGGVYLTVDHVHSLIKKFAEPLIEMGVIYRGREINTAETVTLLGSLFEYQSDKNKVFDINETTEFVISLMTSIDLSNELYSFYESKNDCEVDEYGRVAPECFKQHYWEGICRSYPNQFPKLFESLGATVWDRDPTTGVRKLVCKIPANTLNMAYLEKSIMAARTCHNYSDGDKEEIPYTKGDMMSVFVAMMHIESTILRWDRNKNNIMDPSEVMEAYEIYSPALDGFLEEMPTVIKMLKKQIYQYLVKYEEVPEVKDFGSLWKFVKFLTKIKKATPANRKTIASILLTIGQQGAPSEFNCSLLRNPNQLN